MSRDRSDPDRNGSDQNGSDRNGQTKSARQKSPVPDYFVRVFNGLCDLLSYKAKMSKNNLFIRHILILTNISLF